MDPIEFPPEVHGFRTSFFKGKVHHNVPRAVIPASNIAL
jgi:hypothetical protein